MKSRGFGVASIPFLLALLSHARALGGGFVYDDGDISRRRQLHRRCEAREARADNVDRARHQMIAYCTAIQDSRSPLTDTLVRGGAHPRAIMPCSMTR